MNLDEARERVAEMIEVRCSCGFAEKIEAALERIRAAIKGSGHGYEGYIKLDEMLLTAYEHVDSDPDHYTGVAAVQFDGLCNLQKAVFGLADKVDPPIQKARGWRVGDELECIEAYGTLAFVPGDRAIIVGIVGKIGAPSGFRILKIGASSTCGEYAQKPLSLYFRNLSLEAEQAGEK